jgi:branched-subunit amino acid transport protein
MVLFVGALSIALKASGPVLLGGRTLSAGLMPVLKHLPPSLFAALIVTQVFVHDRGITIDARAGGLLAALVAAYRRAPPIVVLAAATAVTAAIRHLS